MHTRKKTIQSKDGLNYIAFQRSGYENNQIKSILLLATKVYFYKTSKDSAGKRHECEIDLDIAPPRSAC